MGRLATAMMLGPGAGVALLAAACLSTPEITAPAPVVGTVTPAPRTGTPPAAANAPATLGAAPAEAPTAQVLGERATPAATATRTAAVAPEEAIMRDMDQFASRLQAWAGGTVTPDSMMEMMDRASLLMDDVRRNMSSMTESDRAEALQRVSDLVGSMIQVIQAHARQPGAMNRSARPFGPLTPMGGRSSGMMGTPGPTVNPPGGMMGGPGAMVRGTPAAVMSPQQMMTSIDQMRDQTMRMWSGEPGHADMTEMLSQMQTMLAAMAQQAGSFSGQDLQGLAADMAQAMDDMARVVQIHVQQEYGSLPRSKDPDQR